MTYTITDSYGDTSIFDVRRIPNIKNRGYYWCIDTTLNAFEPTMSYRCLIGDLVRICILTPSVAKALFSKYEEDEFLKELRNRLALELL